MSWYLVWALESWSVQPQVCHTTDNKVKFNIIQRGYDAVGGVALKKFYVGSKKSPPLPKYIWQIDLKCWLNDKKSMQTYWERAEVGNVEAATLNIPTHNFLLPLPITSSCRFASAMSHGRTISQLALIAPHIFDNATLYAPYGMLHTLISESVERPRIYRLTADIS